MKNHFYKIKNAVKKRFRLLTNSLLKGNRRFNQKVFTEIYEKDLFNSRSGNQNSVSKSGTGSDLEQTKEVVANLPRLLDKYAIKSILDVPCGDFYWMRHVDLSDIDYIGGDIVSEIVAKNNAEYGSKNKKFIELDVVNDAIPAVDLIICRDLLVHLKNDQIKKALKNMAKSGSKFLLTTSFKNTERNLDNGTIGYWRTINLELPPFDMNDPIDEIFENCTEGNGKFNDKYLLLYRLK